MQGKTIFVTGGNAGIGLATALTFAEEGANVAIFARREDRNAEARALIEAKGVACLTIAGDVTSEHQVADAIARTVDRFGGIHYAFNNAGVSQSAGAITELDASSFAEQIEVNVKGTFLGMKYEIPAIRASGGGAICNNASASGVVATANQSLYSAAKFAVVGMTKAVALECAKEQLRVNVVCPGYTNGDMALRFADAFPDTAAAAIAKHPMNRIGDKFEVARAVLFLCRDATFTTGLALTVDGGRTVG